MIVLENLVASSPGLHLSMEGAFSLHLCASSQCKHQLREGRTLSLCRWADLMMTGLLGRHEISLPFWTLATRFPLLLRSHCGSFAAFINREQGCIFHRFLLLIILSLKELQNLFFHWIYLIFNPFYYFMTSIFSLVSLHTALIFVQSAMSFFALT